MSEEQKKKISDEDMEFSSSKADDQIEPDVILDVPHLKIGEIKMNVENLDAQISVKAQLANFVNIEVGTKIHIDKVNLEIKEVETEAHLRVRLKRVERILLKSLKFLEENPEVVKNFLKSAGEGMQQAKDNENGSGIASKIGDGIQSAGKALGENKAGEWVQKAGEKVSG
ncbi:MAG: hypothetical protein ACK4ND_13925 [Cytophagaceae bacterium]